MGEQKGCNFENLSLLVAVCHCLLPLLAIPLTFLLIPDKLMTDKIGKHRACMHARSHHTRACVTHTHTHACPCTEARAQPSSTRPVG
jgi:hypothetical protein